MNTDVKTFDTLIVAIRQTHEALAHAATKAVNLNLSLRNWFIGYYIAEFELKGADRANYGENLLTELASALRDHNVSNAGRRQLYGYLAFYRSYPQLVRTAPAQLGNIMPQRKRAGKVRTASAQSAGDDGLTTIDQDHLLQNLSYSHFEQLVELDEPIRRRFYEVEALRGNWSVRELKRQIATQLFERSALSKDKDALAHHVQAHAQTQSDAHLIRDPYVFEFLGFKPREVMGERHLEDALLDKLQDFLLELGHGFCFEARQKQWNGRPHLSASMCQSGSALNHSQMRASTMKLTTIGIDLAKSVFQVHGVDEHGKTVMRKQLKRAQFALFFSNLPPCLIGMEACGSAHHWARKLQSFGHTVKLIAPQFVKPYVKSNKHDVADAEAICEAVGRPTMRFVAVKNVEQQAVLSLHRARQGFVKARTAQANQIRSLLAEFGWVIPKGITNIPKQVPLILAEAGNELPGLFRQLIDGLLNYFRELHRQIVELEAQIKAWHRDSPASRKLAEMPGIGPLGATALVASIGDAKAFKNGRQLAAWLGLVPRQHSTGGKQNLLGISKRGDVYLRTLLIHGARSAILAAQRRGDSSNWLAKQLERRHANVAAAALANKNARVVWALLAHDREYQPEYAEAA